MDTQLTPNQLRISSARPSLKDSPMPRVALSARELERILWQVYESLCERGSMYSVPCLLQLLTGCRCGEALTASLWSQDESGVVHLQTLKGSAPREFQASTSRTIWACVEAMREPFFAWLNDSTYRRTIREELRKFGVYRMTANGKAYASTHTFRHNYIQLLAEMGSDTATLLKESGEKTERALNYYLTSKYYTTRQTQNTNIL